MNNIEFHIHYYANLEIGILFLLISSVITFLVVRKQVYSIFDPLFFNFLMGVAGYSVVFYLYYFDLIDEYYYYSFLSTQAAFFIGLSIFSTPKYFSQSNKVSYMAIGITKYMYFLSFFMFFISQITVYYFNGLPIFMESRLAIFSGGSGFGILSRVIYVTSTISLTISSYSILFNKKMGISFLIHYFILFFYIFVSIVSGSKGALLVMIFIISLMLFYSRRKSINRSVESKANKMMLKLVFILFPAAILTVYIQTGVNNLIEPIIAIAMRFIHTGQIFYMVYPNDILNSFPEESAVLALFRDILGALRIYSWDELPTNHGLLAFQYHYDLDILTGPNDRHNTFGLFYFGFYGAIIFSFIMGFILSFIRNYLYTYLKFNLITMSLYVLLVLSANNLNQDPSGMAVGYFFSIMLVFIPLFLISYLLFEISRKK